MQILKLTKVSDQTSLEWQIRQWITFHKINQLTLLPILIKLLKAILSIQLGILLKRELSKMVNLFKRPNHLSQKIAKFITKASDHTIRVSQRKTIQAILIKQSNLN